MNTYHISFPRAEGTRTETIKAESFLETSNGIVFLGEDKAIVGRLVDTPGLFIKLLEP